VLEAYRTDPLVTSCATARWGTESLDAVERVKEGMSRIDVPLLVLHGEDDRLNLAEGARTLFDAVSHPGKRLHIYPGVRHEPHNDFGHEQVATDVEAWLASVVSDQSVL
jgi:alpha-beta hydrolase superfamily lysophospholipase